MAHMQVMQAQGILHQALRWWGSASGHQPLGVMARVYTIAKFWDKARRGKCKVTTRFSEQAMTRFPQQSPARVLGIMQTIHAPRTHSSPYNFTGKYL